MLVSRNASYSIPDRISGQTFTRHSRVSIIPSTSSVVSFFANMSFADPLPSWLLDFKNTFSLAKLTTMMQKGHVAFDTLNFASNTTVSEFPGGRSWSSGYQPFSFCFYFSHDLRNGRIRTCCVDWTLHETRPLRIETGAISEFVVDAGRCLPWCRPMGMEKASICSCKRVFG